MTTVPIQACIFDLDGVLVDTARYHFKSWVKLCDELLGFSLDIKIEEQLKGISRMDSLNIVLSQGGIQKTEEEKKALTKIKNDWYLESLKNLDNSVVLPGVIPFLNTLKADGIPLAVGSASRNARTILTKLGMDKYFVSIVDGNDVIHTKPNPEVFINAARNLQLAESSCVVFEDSKKGLQAAKTGGFRTVGIGHEEVLTEAEAVIPNFKIQNFQSILSLLNS